MNVYANCTLQIVERNNFRDPESGQEIKFNTNFLKDEEGKVLKVNSAIDFTANEGQTGIAVIRVREQDNKVKLSLQKFVETDEPITLDEVIE